MRVLLQRVSRAEVRIRENDGSRVSGRIGRGFVVLVGFTSSDGESHVEWMAEKVAGLRVFADAEDKMNLALADVGGAVLVVSQFTLYGDAQKGRRPSFIDAARPEQAIPLYESFKARLRQHVVNHVAQSLGLVAQRAEVLQPRRIILHPPFAEHLGVEAERGQRCAHLVRDGRDE